MKRCSYSSVSSVAQLCPTLFDPMDCSTPGFPVHHQLPEPTQTHVHHISDAIQPSHPLSPLLLLPSIYPSIRVFSNESVLRIRWPKYWRFSISPSNEYSGLVSFRIDWLDLIREMQIKTTKRYHFTLTRMAIFKKSTGEDMKKSKPSHSAGWMENGAATLENSLTGLQMHSARLPQWLNGSESACQCRGHGLDLWSRKIPHALEQLSLWARTTEPTCYNYWAHVPRVCALQQATKTRSLHTTKSNPH